MSTANVRTRTVGMISSTNMFDEDLNWSMPESRRDARELALQLLYAMEMTGVPPANVFRSLLPKIDNPTEHLQFARRLVEQVYENRAEFDDFIKRRSENWMFDRIAIIDLIILRLAICEFLYAYEVPPKVTIDEALELAKKYSTEKSSSYINGLLDAILIELREQDRLAKSGRGRQED